MPHAAPVALRCENLVDPLGLDEPRPRLTWQVVDARAGAEQSAWQIVADADASAVAAGRGAWDSGRVAGGEPAALYAGAPARPGERLHWAVRSFDAAGAPSPWSAPAWFEAGPDRAAWRARWIGWPHHADAYAVRLLRRAFRLRAAPARARLYATARGLHLSSLNGAVVNPGTLAPGWSDYRRRQRWNAFDVTARLRAGDNVWGAQLAGGWWCGDVAWVRQLYGRAPWYAGELHLTYADGGSEVIATDDGWALAPDGGALRESDLLQGERWDLGRALPGWDAPGFAAAGWLAPAIEAVDTATLVADRAALAGPRQVLPALSVVERGGKWLVDFGQNLAGRVRLRLTGAAGGRWTIRHGEVLDAQGALYTVNLRSAACTDHIVHDGREQWWEPAFTVHGFRWAEIAGPKDVRLAAADVQAVVVHSLDEPALRLETGHRLLDRLQLNIQWGQRGNFVELPTDCPQRDERLGWTGDIQVFARTALWNFDCAAFLDRWLDELNGAQDADGSFPSVAPGIPHFASDGGPGWADAGVEVPWEVYRATGDRRVLARAWPAIARYLAFLRGVDPDRRRAYGDWLHHQQPTACDLLHLAHAARSARLAARIAGVLGDAAGQRAAAVDADAFAAEFNRRALSADGRLAGDSQTIYALALRFGLLPAALRPRAAAHLARLVGLGPRTQTMWSGPPSLTTGFLGVKHLPHALSEHGHAGLAWELLLSERCPSWLFPVVHGATTVWERWDGWTSEKGFNDPSMNSFNHYAYGAVGEWLYQVVAGLDQAEGDAGWGRVVVATTPPPPGSAAAAAVTRCALEFASPRGPLAVSWRVQGGGLALDVALPPTVSAEVLVPTTDAARVRCAGREPAGVTGISVGGAEPGGLRLRVGAGRWAFTAPWG